jgi:CRP-like cAMP-binding protein
MPSFSRDAAQVAPNHRIPLSSLRGIRLFDTLPDSTLQAIAERGRIRLVARGAFLFFDGDAASDAHVLIEGRVKIVHETEDGQEVILRMVQAGDIFGSAGGWGDRVYPATAIALDDVRVFYLPVDELTDLIDFHSDFALALIQELGTRLREAEARIRELQAERVERRIARTLLRLAGKTGHKTLDGIEIELPQSRQHLADLSGATLTTVSRVLSQWDRMGLIVAGRERLTIVRAHELVTIAEDVAASDQN